MSKTTSQIVCDRCGQKTPGLPGLLDWLITPALDEADDKIRVEVAVCPACRTADENAIVDAAQDGLRWINENAGAGGPATMLGDYLSCIDTQLVKRRHQQGDHARCVAEDGCETPGTRLVFSF